MWGRVTILAALGLTWMIAGQGRAAAGDMSGVREAVATVIRNLPDDVRVRVFDYDPEAVRDLDLDSAELLGRAGLSKSESAYTINLDEWGGGYLIAAGTDFLLCNIKYGSVRSCFLIPVHRYEEMRCEKMGFQQKDSGRPTHELLICSKLSLTGTGLYGEGELYFLADKDLEFLGYLPTREYISGWTFVGTASLNAETDRVLLNNSGALQRCVTIEFTTGDESARDVSREACEGYRIDPAARRIVHLSGRNALAANLIDVYRKEIEALAAQAEEK